MKSENRTCFECAARNPTWISLSYGAYLCLECSGEHRRKGVHISFVRSVELDSFSPDQIVQMAVGGNGKAWTYFKQYGMGKTSEGGRPLDYNSKVAIRYKQDLEKACKDMCTSLGVACKTSSSTTTQAPATVSAPISSPAPVVSKSSVPAKAKVVVDDPWNTPFGDAAPVPVSAPPAAKAMPSPIAARAHGKGVPAPTSMPASAPMESVTTPAVVPKASGFLGKGHVAKQIDFDFDFDDLEKEAAKPAPAPPPKVVTELPAPKAPVAPTLATCKCPPEAPPRTVGPPSTAKFANKKGISSDDFFGDFEDEASSQTRYNRFASSGAISSASFFGDEDPAEAIKQVNSDLAKATPIADLARSSILQGSEWFTAYLNKVTD
jgi:ADP-ribosylation factor GTPase-activating protein 2/3